MRGWNATALPQQFTARDEEREWMSRTPEEVAEIESDLRGITAGLSGLGLATAEPEPIVTASALSQLDAAIDGIPGAGKAAFLEARRICSDQVGVAHRTSFLWREDYDAKLASQRMVAYWEYKLKLFGAEKCFLPMTLRGALRDDTVALTQGLIRLLPFKDASGRSILFLDLSRHDPSKYSTQSMLRASWYLYHVAVEDPNACQRSIVMLGTPRGVTQRHREQFDFGLYKAIVEMEMHYLPVRLRAMHICHPSLMFHIINPVWKFLVGRRNRARIVVHYGSDDQVIRSLSEYGLPRYLLPSKIGGDLILDQEGWLSRRFIQEGVPHSVEAIKACRASVTGDLLDILVFIFDDTEAPTKTESNAIPPIKGGMHFMAAGYDHVVQPARTNAVVDACNLHSNTWPVSSVPASQTARTTAFPASPLQTIPTFSVTPSSPTVPAERGEEEDDDWLDEFEDERATRRMNSVQQQISVSSIGDASWTGQKRPPEDTDLLLDIIDLQHFDDDHSLPVIEGQVHRCQGNINIKAPMVTSRNHTRGKSIPGQLSSCAMSASAKILAQNPASICRASDAMNSDGEKKEDRIKAGTAKKAAQNPASPPHSSKKRGDPRMARSVQVKLANPKMSLLDALIEGGFHFPDSAGLRARGGTRNRTVLDGDGVSLYQRKNQLNRRLREARKCDPRMNAAVAAKLADPLLSDVDALLKGGFSYPRIGQPGLCERTIRDSDNVSLYQRKNQLIRRLMEKHQEHNAYLDWKGVELSNKKSGVKCQQQQEVPPLINQKLIEKGWNGIQKAVTQEENSGQLPRRDSFFDQILELPSLPYDESN